MRKVIGYCNLHNSPNLGELTASRTLASTSFLGRYAFVDFTLSNFSNSGIDEIGILVRDHARSLNKHLGFANSWNINTKLGANMVMYNEAIYSNPRYNNDLNNIRANDWFLIKSSAEFVVIAPVHFITTIDYRKVIEQHIATGAEVTIVYSSFKNSKSECIGCDCLTIDERGRIVKIKENRGTTENANISLESYVMSKAVLKQILKDSLEVSSVFSLSEYLAYSIKNLYVLGYKYEGYVRCFDSINKYLEYSLELLNYDVRQQLFKADWPIYTVTHDTPPTKYGKKAQVKNSFVANGAIIDGEVERSIVSRYVVISEGAKIKNSIILTDSVITSDTNLDHCIIDKYARIVCVKNLEGTEEEPLYIKQGDII